MVERGPRSGMNANRERAAGMKPVIRGAWRSGVPRRPTFVMGAPLILAAYWAWAGRCPVEFVSQVLVGGQAVPFRVLPPITRAARLNGTWPRLELWPSHKNKRHALKPWPASGEGLMTGG